jgi:hypothetical protein
VKFPADHVLGAQRNGVNHVSMNLGSGTRLPGHFLPATEDLALFEAGDRAGYAALRVVQYRTNGGERVPVGGQTYVFADVVGWNAGGDGAAGSY